MTEDKNSKFPKDFLWGASVSAYQVEGGNHNQWSVWEESHADRLAKTAEHRLNWLPDWEQVKCQAEDPANYINGASVDHYHRYNEDFKIAKSLNLNAFRFGIEWSRIEPTKGQWNQEAIDHYRTYIADLKRQGLYPVITLWHWTAPTWFTDKGGFAKRRNIKYFERYVERVAQDLIVPCGRVLTLNEPNSYIGQSYIDGQWPPQKRNLIKAAKVFYNLALAHRRVYRFLKNLEPNLQIGVATQCNNSQPKRPNNPLDRLVASSANYWWNWWFLNRIKKQQDFIGFNYYFTDYFKGVFRSNPTHYHRARHTSQRGMHRGRRHNPLGPLSDTGWYMEPSGLYKVIKQAAKRYKQPIFITETGVADAKDQYREWWLQETLEAVQKAQADGVNIMGFMCWSLLDNFEWSTGWWAKFGLVSVDRAHDMQRKIRPSAKWFADYIAKSHN